MKAVAQCPSPIGSYEVGFQLAPRLNAAGRLEDAEEALRLLLAGDAAEAEPLARSLDARNRQRQQIERAMAEQVIAAVHARFNRRKGFCHRRRTRLLAYRRGGHCRLAGGEAILPPGASFWAATAPCGAARAEASKDLIWRRRLRNCDDLLTRHGGHSMAAGVTVPPAQVGLFRARLNELARLALKPEQLEPSLRLDAEVAGSDLALDLMEPLAALAPTGQGNPPVQWMIRGLTLRQPPQRMGRENQHVKLRLTDGRAALEAVWWNCGQAPMPERPFRPRLHPRHQRVPGPPLRAIAPSGLAARLVNFNYKRCHDAPAPPEAANLGFQSRRPDARLSAVKNIQPNLLEKAVERLKSEFQPEQIWLFGSHAWGTPTEAGPE